MTADDQTPGPAEGATTLEEAVAEFEAMGFTGDFSLRPEGRIHCGTCDHTTAPTSADISGERRLEGASDPDDMQIVLAIVCPNCATRGTLVVGYGPVSDAESQDLLANLVP